MAWFQTTCALVIAIAGPLIFVIVRHEIRFSRLRALFEFDQLFNVSDPHQSGKPAPAPTYEYVRARYTDDIEFPEDFEPEWIRKFDMGKTRFRNFVRSLTWWKLKSSRSILLASVPLIVMVAYGLLVLFASGGERDLPLNMGPFPPPALIVGHASVAQRSIQVENVTIVAEAAFIGAYLFTQLLFLRALATFDLSAMTVLRGTLYFVVGILAAVVLYRAFPDLPAQTLAGLRTIADETGQAVAPDKAPKPLSKHKTTPAAEVGGATGADSASGPLTEKPISRVWIALAFLLGFIPDLAVNTIIGRVQRVFRIKSTDNTLMDATESIPLELIDGIDVLTRFRLQESNIFEMQNLAVANPVMLFIETPFGIYQVIDWVAQAQLCVSVGPQRFLELQKRSIRTIFDLERAVLSAYTTSQLRQYIASILLKLSVKPEKKRGLKHFFRTEHKTDSPDDIQFATTAAQLFSQSAIASDGKSAAVDPDETIKHLVRTMVDDLHVCRLRQVWQQIMSKIDGIEPSNHSSDRLWDTEWPPGLPNGIARPPYPGR